MIWRSISADGSDTADDAKLRKCSTSWRSGSDADFGRWSGNSGNEEPRDRELRKRGIAAQEAAQTAGSYDGPWLLANSPAVKVALSNAYFASLGLPELTVTGWLNPPNRRMRTRISGGVAGGIKKSRKRHAVR